MVLEDQHKQAMEELVTRRETLRARPSTGKMRKDNYEIKQMENRLDKALTSYNDIRSGNKQLRSEIDVWRKQQRNQTRVNKGFGREISGAVDSVKKLNNASY